MNRFQSPSALENSLVAAFEGNTIAALNAAQSCKVTFEGRNSIGNEFGLGVRVEMKTTRGNVMTPTGKAHWAKVGDGIVGHSKRALVALVEPFGFSWSDVEKAFARPGEGGKQVVSLLYLVNRLEANRETCLV